METKSQFMNNIRIGIIGTGRITTRFIPEARTVEGVELSCIYNPRLSSAQEHARTYNIARATDQIEEFLAECDAVYIAAPHHTHESYVRQMLTAGKHVLCEKPMVFSEKAAKELFALADEKHLVLMEAIKTAYCPGFLEILEKVRSGAIGEVCDVEAAFTKLSASNVREIWEEQCGGSFIELGTYPLLPILKLLGMENTDIRFQSVRMGSGWDGYTKAILSYPGAMAIAKTGLSVKSEGQLLISGTKGYILAESPWWLTRKYEVRYEDPAKREIHECEFEEAGLRYEIQAFVERIADAGVRASGTNASQDSSRKEKDKFGRQPEGQLSGSAAAICGADSGKYGISPAESIWLAKQMEAFLAYIGETAGNKECLRTGNPEAFCEKETFCEKGTAEGMSGEQDNVGISAVRIWAHRGCSMQYPENTLEAFAAAAALDGLTGIELDVQMTKDGELVVIHDETVDRTTNGTGEVRSFTLTELQKLQISWDGDYTSRIPTLEEVFQLLSPACHSKRLKINIEMKNSRIRYEGMEEKVLALVDRYHLKCSIIYSSFLPESMGLIKQLNPEAHTGILGGDALWCLKEMERMHADAIHPWIGGLPLNEGDVRKIQGIPVRVWNGEEPFFSQNRVLKETKMTKYAKLGATDIFTNVPEMYL